jgi:hypothetical protein
MLLVYTTERTREEASPEELAAVVSGHHAAMAEARKGGVLVAAEPLRPTSTATTIRRDGERFLTIDGPFAETKEQLAGYYILDCADLDEAIDWARRIPTACGGGEGCIEIRPIEPLPPPA